MVEAGCESFVFRYVENKVNLFGASKLNQKYLKVLVEVTIVTLVRKIFR